jgi:hypothetical protein
MVDEPYLPDEQDIVLSWALMTPHWYGLKVSVFTHSLQRRKRYGRRVLSALLTQRGPGIAFAKRNDDKSDGFFSAMGFRRQHAIYVFCG